MATFGHFSPRKKTMRKILNPHFFLSLSVKKIPPKNKMCERKCVFLKIVFPIALYSRIVYSLKSHFVFIFTRYSLIWKTLGEIS